MTSKEKAILAKIGSIKALAAALINEVSMLEKELDLNQNKPARLDFKALARARFAKNRRPK